MADKKFELTPEIKAKLEEAKKKVSELSADDLDGVAGGAAAPTDWKTKILTDYDRYGYDFALQMVVVNFGLPKEVVDQMVNEYSDKRKGLEAFLTEWLGL